MIRALEAFSSARLSAFAIAIATSSVKDARRASESRGRVRPVLEPAPIIPQSRPSTMIGLATAERMPVSWAVTLSGPEALA
jgi:DNA-directed RNA polymerase specialized sigma24 family protein